MQIVNKKAKFEYVLTGDKVEAGLSLIGAEAKAIREGRADLSQAVVRIMDGEAYLINANIPALGPKNYNPTQMRKLLLHRQEITQLTSKAKQQKLTLVPLKLYNKALPDGRQGRLMKLSIALGKPKRKFEKKEDIKRQDVERDLERELS
jgi:SsrA-binding protein